MNSYLLLRDNQESGPYTLDEIRRKNLQPLDLIWIEGKSTSWNYPTEISELTQFVKTKRKNYTRTKRNHFASGKAVTTRVNTVSVPIQNSTSQIASNHSAVALSSNETHNYFVYEDTEKELFTDVKFEQRPVKKTLGVNSNIMGLILIVIGVVMGSFVVKNIVESFGDNSPIADDQAKQIQSISYQSSNTAYAPHQDYKQQPVTNALGLTKTDTSKKIKHHVVVAGIATQTTQVQTQLIVPTDNSTNNPVAKTDGPVTTINQPTKTDDQKDITPVKNPENKAEKKDEAKDVKETKKKDVRSMVHVSATNYKVGMFGGVSDLELQVTNDSPTTVDRATVEVSFLKPNGSVIKTETIEVNSIAPGKSKKVQVPSSSRGTKIQFRINGVTSREADAS